MHLLLRRPQRRRRRKRDPESAASHLSQAGEVAVRFMHGG
jgi:hypothetical protein